LLLVGPRLGRQGTRPSQLLRDGLMAFLVHRYAHTAARHGDTCTPHALFRTIRSALLQRNREARGWLEANKEWALEHWAELGFPLPSTSQQRENASRQLAAPSLYFHAERREQDGARFRRCALLDPVAASCAVTPYSSAQRHATAFTVMHNGSGGCPTEPHELYGTPLPDMVRWCT
jgi:hypothetical protein